MLRCTLLPSTEGDEGRSLPARMEYCCCSNMRSCGCNLRVYADSRAGNPAYWAVLPQRPRAGCFGSQRLATSDTDAKILDFTIIEGSLFYIDYQDHGKNTDIYLREMSLKGGQRQAASTVVPGCRPQYLDNTGSVLRFYDLESRTLSSYDPVAGAVVRSQPSNYFAESRTFREGTTIGRVNLKGRLHEKVFTDDQIREMSERLPADEFQAFLINRTKVSYELGKYEIVLLGSELEVKMPLLPLYKHEEIVDGVDSRSRADQGLYPQLVRMSPGRDIAAVFRKHMPGITLFTEDGSTLNQGSLR